MGIERNTYAASAYIAVDRADVFAYTAELRNLDEWTLNSRMEKQIDERTWRGSATGYHDGLYYHVRTAAAAGIGVVEWHCGRQLGQYGQVYPVLVFPDSYPRARPHEQAGGDRAGTFVHWIACADPERVGESFMDGIGPVHDTEIRGLKAHLERRRGLAEPAQSDLTMASETIYVEAPFGLVRSYLANPRTTAAWSPLFTASRSSADRADDDGIEGTDEYDREVHLSSTVHDVGSWALIEQDYYYPADGLTLRCPLLVLPCSYVFGNPKADGVLVHRVFWSGDDSGRFGRLAPASFGAEAVTIKRILEDEAGNRGALAASLSYRPSAPAGARPALRAATDDRLPIGS